MPPRPERVMDTREQDGFERGQGVELITPPEDLEHGTRPGGRGPGGVPGGVGSKNRGHVHVYRGGSIRIQRGVYPL